ncbi:unannotated protein [freshwater metagenome]|uniref:Unannotated protein n=1 Tax=freshwater metagenome TaxID=449393 RepID=A0A6J7LPB1_9ZZZZ
MGVITDRHMRVGVNDLLIPGDISHAPRYGFSTQGGAVLAGGVYV